MARRSSSLLKLSGERRHVTALFYDIVGSTEVLVRSDPERFYSTLKEFHKASETIIRRHGGFIHQKLGDGACCYFGYPEQSEGSAEKAIRASLELIERLGAKTRAQVGPFKVRIGIATGIVVISPDGREIVGTTPVLAARLQAEAKPNTIAVAESTRDLALNAFEYAPARHAHLKGFAQSIPIWRPIAIKADGIRPVAERMSAALQGREHELSLLLQNWQKTSATSGRSVAIVGEPGVGKSRLISELQREVERRGGQIVAMQCEKDLSSRPLQPFVGFLEAHLGGGSLKTVNTVELYAKLLSVGAHVTPESASILSEFVGENVRANAGSIRVLDISGQVLRRDVIHAAIDLVKSVASGRRTLIAIEDVHWADAMTVEFIEQLVAGCSDLPMLIVQTSRRHISMAATHSVELHLSSLDAVAAGSLVRLIWGGETPARLPEFVVEKSDGIPLFIEELTLFLKRQIGSASGPLEWNHLLHEHGISSLNDILAARLADVGKSRRLAQIASVIGRDFNIELLGALLDTGGDRAVPRKDVETLVAAGMVERLNESAGTYRFRHALIHEAAYASLLQSDSRRIHRHIGRLLSTGQVKSIPADLAAWQCAQGGLHQDAARFALNAAEDCVLRSAMREAGQLLDLGEREISALPRNTATRELRLDLLQLRGVVSAALMGEGSRQTRTVYSKAMTLMKNSGPDSSGKRFPLYWGWWFTAPNIRAQQSRAEVLVEDMKVVADPEARLQSYHCAWATSFHAAQHDFCLACVSKGLALYDAERALRNRAFYGGHDAMVCGLGESALSNLLVAEPEASEAAIAQCLDWSAATEHVGSIVHGLYYAVVLRRCIGDYEAVAALGAQMLALSVEHGLGASGARANMYGGWAKVMSGTLAVGGAQFQEGLELQEKMGTDDNLSVHIDMHSEVLQKSGRLSDSLKLIEKGIAVANTSGQRFWLPELYRRRAELRLLLGNDARLAKKDLRLSIRLAQSQRALWLQRRSEKTLQSLGELARVGAAS